MNYLIIHRQSNLIINVVSSNGIVGSDATYKAIRVSEKVLDRYYRLKMKPNRKGTLVDVGEMASVSPAFKELLI